MRALYKRLLGYESRYWLYKLRHPTHFKKKRTDVYRSPKGDFSLRAYDKHQCIFVHITKSAGTSLGKTLFGELPSHYTAAEYRVIFGRHDFNRYFKFAFVRNPWDRLYSAYSYLKDGGWNETDKAWADQYLANHDDFNDFVMNWLEEDKLNSHIHFWPQYRFICDQRGEILVDHVARFETIEQDFKIITDKINLDRQLIHTNQSKRQGYREAYSDEAIEKVRKLYQFDINLFKYTFESIKEPGKLI